MGLVLWVLAGLCWGFWWVSGCFGLLVMVCDAGGFRERFLVVDFGFGVLVFAFVGDLVLLDFSVLRELTRHRFLPWL